jgi:pimeloyl-ACP methyl ester carboxylesterase
MMAEPHLSRVPHQAIREIAEWLGTRILVTTAEPLAIDTSCFGPVQACFASKRPGPSRSGDTVRERLLRIGKLELFGILSEPANASQELPTVVILNAGSASRVGPGRLYVQLARHLAGYGFPCLRLDACGLGDSVGGSVEHENDPYPATVFRDVAATLEQLPARFGVKRCLLLGLCSGAYAAFQSAVQLADPALVESILINPLTFYWREGLSLDPAVVNRQLKESCSIARAKNLRKLWKFLRGRTDIGYVDAARLLVRRAQNYIQQLVRKPIRVDQIRPISVAAHPVQEDLPADLARIGAAGRHLSVFLAENDPGYVIMNFHARKQVQAMRRAGTLHLATIPGGDHTFSRRVARAKLIQSITDYLIERYAADP